MIKEDNDWKIFELQLLNLAASHFEKYWKSFEHGLSIDKKQFLRQWYFFKQLLVQNELIFNLWMKLMKLLFGNTFS